MKSDYFDIYEKLNNTDLAVREVQLHFEELKNMNNFSEITDYNKYLEELRTTIHLKIKELNKLR